MDPPLEFSELPVWLSRLTHILYLLEIELDNACRALGMYETHSINGKNIMGLLKLLFDLIIFQES